VLAVHDGKGVSLLKATTVRVVTSLTVCGLPVMAAFR
jgi:hypothetical protein